MPDPTQTAAERAEDEAWTRGFAACLAIVIRMHDRPSMAADIAKSVGLHVESFEKCDVEPYDLDPIREAINGK